MLKGLGALAPVLAHKETLANASAQVQTESVTEAHPPPLFIGSCQGRQVKRAYQQLDLLLVWFCFVS